MLPKCYDLLADNLMRIEFRTIEISKLVLTYLGIMGVCFVVHYFLNFTVHASFFLILPLPLHFIFKGKMAVILSDGELVIQWIKKPIFCSLGNKRIKLSEIVRWKYEKGVRGPDQFMVIEESGTKTKIRPSMFSMKDLETELWGELDKRISAFHSDTPKVILQQKILESGYISDLNVSLENLKVARISIVVVTLLLFLLGSIYSDSRIPWMLFLFFFSALVIVTFRYAYLKTEKSEALSVFK